MNYFHHKHAVITGAGSGIGRALAQQLNAAGCHLYLSDIDGDGLAATIASFDNPNAPSHGTVVDVSDVDAVNRWAAAVGEISPELHLVVNNAGVDLMASAAQTTLHDFHWLMNINFWGVVHGCNAFIPALKKAEKSHLVNISSVFGMIAVPNQSAYNAAKFAVRGYSESLQQELDLADSPIKLCCVHPGGIDTNIARRARNVDPNATADSQQAMFAPHARTSATEAARRILRAAEKGQRRLLIGRDAKIIDWVVRLFPTAYARLLYDSAVNPEPNIQ
ncbi:MAG: NAD(P)-dependent dehydrogenase (short-subunit alcohol dehydrogenase family) [Glaciecola sp.]|jgi:NAD(P)-dependent dehydrogenase (short-subunit alcohol dehydrogenase family)|uniref:SDR family NAD(P)-dependent oxidoreductase n=1 Tax=Congregibacter sp. TaxID=2744308 RepID=UPI0039E70508